MNPKMSFYLNLNPRLDCDHRDSRLIISIDGKQIVIKNRKFEEGVLISGQEQPPLGWYSERFDSIEKGKVFCFRDNIDSAETVYQTEITY